MENDTPPPPALANTGERLMTDNQTHTAIEHLHRYALAKELAAGIDVLDIACGEGYGSYLLADCAKNVLGVDVAADAIAHAATKYQRPNLRFVHGSATAVPLQDDSVDLVVSFETIEHLREHDDMLAELRRVLRPGGRAIISSPDRRFYSEATGHKNPFHLRELSCDEFCGLLARFFPHCRLLRQRVVHGSLIVPEGSMSGFREYRGNFSGFHSRPLLQEAMYDVIVASDEPLPAWPLSFWDGTNTCQQALPDGALQREAPPQSLGRIGMIDRIIGEIRRVIRRCRPE